MEGGWKGTPGLLVLLAVLAASGYCYQILEGPKNSTAVEGSEARFNCTVSQGWQLIMWALNGMVVLSITPKESIITNSRFTSATYQEDGNFTSEMIIHAVQLNDTGLIRCSIQNSNWDKYSFLSVQVVGDLHIPVGGLVVTHDEPCNFTCYALGWSPLPDLAWEMGLPVARWRSWVREPADHRSAVSGLSLTARGNGTLTCIAKVKGLNVLKSVTVNLTVLPPPLGSSDNDKPSSSWPDWPQPLVLATALLAMVAVVLIIFCCCCCCCGNCCCRKCCPCSFCCRRKKKGSSYPSKIRISAELKRNNETLETKTKGGKENFGYSSDETRMAESSYASKIRISPELKRNNETLETKTKDGKENYGFSYDETGMAEISSHPLKPDESRVSEERNSQQPQGPEEPQLLEIHHVSLDMPSPEKISNAPTV
ncbi:immunoglobulin superfamily member 5 isoform X1 [Dasypus novemcinctus]|uniref:immunoglobulin superfamily member 5 isoform X1 n=1 Tax=Dasypus novemcinctus TaxID=9361 RepID=UPI0003290D5D|nr:immunoglobulin superfamily member 5 isoform X1 [Dasypus novemcinctus]